MKTLTVTHIALLFSLSLHVLALALGGGFVDVGLQPVERYEIRFSPSAGSTPEKNVTRRESKSNRPPQVHQVSAVKAEEHHISAEREQRKETLLYAPPETVHSAPPSAAPHRRYGGR